MAGDRASNVVPFPAVRSVDGELVRALARGDRQAITDVYREHGPKVRAYARRMLGDEAAAEDVIHDVFVALPAAMARYRGDAKLGTFLIAMAVNHCRRRARSAARGLRAVERMERREVEGPARTPEAEARRRELAAALGRGLATLSVEHREVFVLCAVEERGSPEVAELLGVPEGTVRTRLFHARKKLRAFLEDEGVR